MNVNNEPIAGGLITWRILLIPLIIGTVLLVTDYAFMWYDRWNCDNMGGSYSIDNDGIFQTSHCQVTEQNQIISRECYINGVMTNCEDLGADIDHFYMGNGRYEINGVCPGVDDNRTLMDCINEVKALQDADKKEREKAAATAWDAYEKATAPAREAYEKRLKEIEEGVA